MATRSNDITTPGASAMLPAGVSVLERGWLSSNSVVLRGDGEAAVVDSGYGTHGAQTVDLIARVADKLPVRTLVNTHLHSDHCGGNAALQGRYPAMQILIPPGLADAVRQWDTAALSYSATGQVCPRFHFDGTLRPAETVDLAGTHWQVHAAPGHDPHSVVLFEPMSGTLLSADALWENGFGIVFPELEGERAFAEVADTLSLIEELDPRVVVPGHGAVFADVASALARARSRLAAFEADPARHAAHAAKVLLKFKLLELQEAALRVFVQWAENTAYFSLVHSRWFPQLGLREWICGLLGELARSGAARIDGEHILNA